MASPSPTSERIVRAVYRACTVPGAPPPYDRVSLKIFYPAVPDDSEEQRNAGVVPADKIGSPFPVLVVMPGINVGPESYAWLAKRLASRGVVTVTYSLIAEEMPGYVSLSPGLDLGAITPAGWGTKPSSTALASILDRLRDENEAGVLQGCLDLDRVVTAGHSAGGSVAIYNARSDWFPGLRGAVSYAAHAAPAMVLGFEPGDMLDLKNDVPIFLIGGVRDGVMAASAHRYGGNRSDKILQTFDEGISGPGQLAMVSGANHFSLAYPVDDSTGRHFLDEPEEGDGEVLRALLADLFESFVLDCCDGGQRVKELSAHALVSDFRSR